VGLMMLGFEMDWIGFCFARDDTMRAGGVDGV